VDGPALVAAVNAATGTGAGAGAGGGLAYAGRLAGGNAGAVTANRPDGTPVVLTYWDATTVGRGALITDLVGRLTAVGYPVPAYELVPLTVGAAVVQERVNGVPGARPTPRLVERVLTLTDRQAGLTAAPAGRLADLHLTGDGLGYCLHGPLRQHSTASRELLSWIEDVGRSAPADAFRGTDVVHYDLHLENVLVRPDDPETVAAVVDWAGVRVGDRLLDLVTFGFDVSRRGGDDSPVRDRLAAADPGRVRAYVAHLALRYVDWVIRHGAPADVDAWLAVATRWRTWTG
jgi:aminoglycoside phosphotransferase (APT) family kinase protein